MQDLFSGTRRLQFIISQKRIDINNRLWTGNKTNYRIIRNGQLDRQTRTTAIVHYQKKYCASGLALHLNIFVHYDMNQVYTLHVKLELKLQLIVLYSCMCGVFYNIHHENFSTRTQKLINSIGGAPRKWSARYLIRSRDYHRIIRTLGGLLITLID